MLVGPRLCPEKWSKPEQNLGFARRTEPEKTSVKSCKLFDDQREEFLHDSWFYLVPILAAKRSSEFWLLLRTKVTEEYV